MTHPAETDLAILENVPLGSRTTLHVGGPARFYAEPRAVSAVQYGLLWARERGIPIMVLGGGSNLLIADRGVSALVLRLRITGIDVYTSPNAVHVTAGAGERWEPFVAHATSEGWAGVECLSGIPGDVGATPIQNVGAYGQEVADTIESVSAVDRETGEVVELSAEKCAFSYRDSAFKGVLKDRHILTHVRFRLTPNGAPKIVYTELAKALADNKAPSIADVRNTVLALRRSKSMVYDPADPNHCSAGSFFTNPIVNDTTLAEVEKVAGPMLGAGQKFPKYPAGEGRTKLAAAWLIEHAGFTKGTSDGAVGLSTNHALAIINRGGATASQIVAFAIRIKRAVYNTFGVSLAVEPMLVGFDADEIAELAAPIL
ncbi:MAG: UDP-N-acetylmuramate dehydrogenase [Polyangiaceae bacterium]|nr:UDP-N-acetylmuramate dehydrogenase [Polyangiaceae bacterium]